ncbi:tRNA (adenine(58)-N(1))-methyltransferase non-catalytic subunit trm6 [Nowakowskiella sp. JEL0407]|nr:tRNA (adenine(58)-N(1))-methyltransferase non-catalytic subunit trm6 [Nowakowskiella sp. JEL0407]KAJ3125044.1 tRNA (adenine(58)-N(1))-methyltransferase non-catalytic subunit trm6 [Nowakowskiella sp. JEL0407]
MSITKKSWKIQENETVIIRLPSDNLKVVKVKRDTVVNLGKFGEFKTNDLIGKWYEVPYEVFGANQLRRALVNSVLETMEIDNSDGNNNSKINDDSASQKLSHTQIETLKQQSLKGSVSSQSVIKTIVTNSSTFDQKTEFAKAKYIKRKEQKFSKSFRVFKPSARMMLELYTAKKAAKIRDLRIDTLAQMMTVANVRAGSRFIVVDDCAGMVLAAVLERMQGEGTVMLLHPNDMPSYHIVTEMDFSEDIMSTIQTLSWSRLEPNVDENPEFHNPGDLNTKR